MSRADVVAMAKAIISMDEEIQSLRWEVEKLRMENGEFREDRQRAVHEYERQFGGIITKLLEKSEEK